MNEPIIDHEVRIRMLEAGINNIDKNLTEIRKEMKSQFLWTLGLAFGFVGIVLLPVITAEIIAIIKSI